MLLTSWIDLHPNEFEVLGPDSSAGRQDSDRDLASPRNPPEHWGGCDVVVAVAMKTGWILKKKYSETSWAKCSSSSGGVRPSPQIGQP